VKNSLDSKFTGYIKKSVMRHSRVGSMPSEPPFPKKNEVWGLLQQNFQKSDRFKMSSIMYDVIFCNN